MRERATLSLGENTLPACEPRTHTCAVRVYLAYLPTNLLLLRRLLCARDYLLKDGILGVTRVRAYPRVSYTSPAIHVYRRMRERDSPVTRAVRAP